MKTLMMHLMGAAPTVKNGDKAKFVYEFVTQELGVDNMDAVKLFLFKMHRKIGPGTYGETMLDNIYTWLTLGNSVGRLATPSVERSPSASRWLWLLA